MGRPKRKRKEQNEKCSSIVFDGNKNKNDVTVNGAKKYDIDRKTNSCSSSSPKSPNDGTEFVLNENEISEFETNGFILLKGAFSSSAAKDGRDFVAKILEKRHGIVLSDPKSWVERQGIPECFGHQNENGSVIPFASEILSSKKLQGALNQLCGYKRWEHFGLGWWIITFPGFHSSCEQDGQDTDVAGHWHIDGAHYVHHVNSAESGLLAFFLFNDMQSPTAGGTALIKGSHRKVATILMNSEPYGLRSKQLNKAAIAAVFGDDFSRNSTNGRGSSNGNKHESKSNGERKMDESAEIHRIVGQAGDVVLAHPFLLHARSKNLGLKGNKDAVRFMCNPNISLRGPMNIPRSRKKLKKFMAQQQSSCAHKMTPHTPVELSIANAIIGADELKKK